MVTLTELLNEAQEIRTEQFIINTRISAFQGTLAKYKEERQKID